MDKDELELVYLYLELGPSRKWTAMRWTASNGFLDRRLGYAALLVVWPVAALTLASQLS